MTDDGLERYRVISTLGTGGMATVLLAEDLRLARRVALKQLVGDPGLRLGKGRESDQTLVSRLRREALLGASVSHPNLVSIYDVVSTDQDGLVIVMEYVPGETLRDRMAREGRLPADVALPILRGIASGLDAIHRRGIVHRDLKPANVLLGDGDTVKLADFGIATGAESTRITSQGAVVGTFRYMAPEQLEDAPSSPAMDIYALAVVALEMLTGERARRESHPIALAHALATQPPPDLRTAWPEAPPAAAEVLLRGMARDPSLRPRRAGELVGRLQAALEDETTRHPLGSRVSKRDRRRPVAGAADLSPGECEAPPKSAAPAVSTGAPSAAVTPPRVVPPRGAPSRAAASRAAPGRATVTAGAERGTGAGRRRRLVAPIALLAVLGGVAAAVIATSGPSGSSPGTKVSSVGKHTHHAGTNRSSARRPSSSTTGGSAQAKTTSSSARTSSSSSSSSTTSSTSSSTTTPTPAGPGATGSAASTPVQAVESFYHAAADHEYASAWSLADPHFQQQLGGYTSFQAGQAGDRSITFNKATVTDQTATSATVAVQTTSERTNGTESCNGNVNLVKTGATWQLDQIGIDCS